MNQIGSIQFDFLTQNEDFARELNSDWDRFFSQAVEPVLDAVLSKLSLPSDVIIINALELDLGTIPEHLFNERFPIVLREKLEEAMLVPVLDAGPQKNPQAPIKENSSLIRNPGCNPKVGQSAKSNLQFLHESPVPESRKGRHILAQDNVLGTQAGNEFECCKHAIKLNPGTSIYSSIYHLFDLLKYFLLYGTLPWYTDTKYKDINFLFGEVIRHNGKKLKHFLQTYGHYTSLQERLVYQLTDPGLEQGIRLFSPSESTFIISYIKFLVSKYKTLPKPQIRETTYRHTVWRVVYAYLLTSRSSYFNKKTFVMSTVAALASGINSTYFELLDILTDKMEKLAETTLITHELYRLLSELKNESAADRFKTIATDAAKLYQTLEELFRTDLPMQLQHPDKEALIHILIHPDTCRTFLQFLNEEEIIRLVPILIPEESKFVIAYARSLDYQKEKGFLTGKAGHEFSKLKWQFIFPLLFENRGSTLNRKHFVYGVIRQIAAHYNLSFIELLVYFNREPSLLQHDRELKQILLTLYNEIKNHPVPGSSPGPQKNSRSKIINPNPLQMQRFTLANTSPVLTHAIEAILEKDTSNSCNRHQIADVLKKISAHYNITYIDLLNDLCTEKNFRLFPDKIQRILKSLYQEEVIRLIRQSGTLLSTTGKQTLLKLLLPEASRFIMHCLEWLEACKKAGLLPRIADSSFRSVLWQQTTGILYLSGSSKRFDLSQFVTQLIPQLARYYQIPLSTLAEEIKRKTSRLENISPELHTLLAQTVPTQAENKKPFSTAEFPVQVERMDIPNAGIVLLAPWFPRLYTLLELTDENGFINQEAQFKAIWLIQYAAFEQTDFLEHELALNKILAGLEIDTPLPASLELTDREKETVLSMVEGAKNNWPQLRNSSVKSLQEAFLQREGLLDIQDDHFRLTVEEKSYDLLLDTLPWNFRMIKQSWMQKRIEVKWR